MVDPHAGAQQSRDGTERDVAGVGFAMSGGHRRSPARRERNGLSGQSTLAYPGWPDDVDDAARAAHRLVQQCGQKVQLTRAADQRPIAAVTRLMFLDRQQPPRPNRGVCTLDRMQFVLSEHHRVLDQSGRRLTEHDTTGWRYRFHPLRHTDLFSDGRVTSVVRTDFAGNDLTRVQPDPQLQDDAVAVRHIIGERGSLILNLQCGDTCTNGVILQGHWRTEHRHDPVAGELVDGTAVTLHHRRRAVEQVGHDFTQPLRTHDRGDVHRMHDVGEQHRHLLVLGHDSGERHGCTTFVAEFRVAQRRAARLDSSIAVVIRHRSLTSISSPSRRARAYRVCT